MSHIRCSLVHERSSIFKCKQHTIYEPRILSLRKRLLSYKLWGTIIEPDLAQCLIAMIAEFAAPGEVILF